MTGLNPLLWAPWRSRLFRKRPRGACIFCAARRSRRDRAHHVIARGRWVFALLNRFPYNNGHVMIAPYRHVGALEALRPDEWAESLAMSQRLISRLRRALRPDGFNLGVNLGRVAGAGIPGHLHLHLVPRWQGDTNFMPVIAQTKVISQSLDEVYARMTPKGAGRWSPPRKRGAPRQRHRVPSPLRGGRNPAERQRSPGNPSTSLRVPRVEGVPSLSREPGASVAG
jgi:ATP adenylyltransferase